MFIKTHNSSVEIAANRFSVNVDWPKEAPPGKYEVVAYQCRDGSVVSEQTASLELVSVGFPARIYTLAMESAPTYGVLAVVLAICAGFFIDFLASRLFGKRRKAGH